MKWWALYRLKSENPRARLRAARRLAREGDARALAPLVDFLKERDFHVRLAAVEALGWVGGVEAVPHLLAALKDASGEVQCAAARALGEAKSLQAVEPLVELVNDSWVGTREAAKRALRQIGDRRTIRLLALKLADTGAREVLNALYSFDDNWEKSEEMRALVPKLIEKLSEKGAHTLHTVELLESVGDPRTLEALAGLLGRSTQWVQETARKALDKIEPAWRTTELGQRTAAAVAKLLQEGKPEERSAAAWALGHALGGPEVVPQLVEALKDEDPYVRRAAASSLGSLKNERCIAPLVAAQADSDGGVRSEVEEALEKSYPSWASALEARAAIPLLVAALQSPAAVTRGQAASTLGKLGEREALGPLVRALGDSESWVHSRVAEALAAIDPAWRSAALARAAIPHFVKELGSRLYEAESALEAIDPKWTELEAAREAIPFLIPYVTGEMELGWHPSRTIPGHARDLLWMIDREWQKTPQAKTVIPVMVAQLLELPTFAEKAQRVEQVLEGIDPGWRASAAAAEAVAPLVAALGSGDAKVRSQAAERLGILRAGAAARALADLLADKATEVVGAAVGALGKIGATGNQEAVDTLVAALREDDPYIRFVATCALSEVGGPRVFEPLVGRLRDPENKVREEAVQGLRKLGDARAVASLMAVLCDKDSSREVRVGAAEALEVFRDPLALPALIAALEFGEAEQQAAAAALGRIGDRRAIEPLWALENHRSVFVRLEVASALLALGDAGVVRLLLKCAREKAVAERAVQRICHLLRSRAGSVAENDLEQVANLSGIVQQQLRDPDDMFSGTIEVAVECSEAWRLAEEELSRRGRR
jgi:HEAT repeat protein